MDGLNPKQEAVLRIIARNIARLGYPPTLSEIARDFGCRHANIHQRYLPILKQRGYIELTGEARGIRLTDKSKAFLEDRTEVTPAEADLLALLGYEIGPLVHK